MLAAGVYDLGLTAGEVLNLTPRSFFALWRRHEAAESAEDRRAATVCTLLANIHRNQKERPRPFELQDFMPRKSGSSEPKRQTVEQMIATLQGLPGKWSTEPNG
jgi:hypothetical protein